MQSHLTGLVCGIRVGSSVLIRMSLFALALGAALRSDEDAPRVEVAVTFLSRQSVVPASIAPNPVVVKDGRVAMLGAIDPFKLADQMVNQHVAEEVAAPKVLVNLGVSAQIMSFMGDEAGQRGFGYVAKVDAKGDAYTLNLTLGDPGQKGLVNDSKFTLTLKPGESALIQPTKTICDLPMMALVHVENVQQEVELLTAH